VVAQDVQRDRRQPGALAAAPAVKPTAGAVGRLEGVGQEILCEPTIARAIDVEGEQLLGVLGVQAIEIGPAHRG